MKGDEFGEYKDIKELRKKAIQYYKDNLQGTSVVNEALVKIDLDENGLIEFTSEGRDKVKSNSAKEETLLLIKHLPKLIAEAKTIEYKDAKSERHRKLGDSFYYLYTEFSKDGKVIPLEITLKKLHTGDIHYYNHTVNPANNNKNALVSPRTESSNEANVSPAVSASSVAFTVPRGQEKVNNEPNTAQAQGRSDNQGGFSDARILDNITPALKIHEILVGGVISTVFLNFPRNKWRHVVFEPPKACKL